MKIKIALAACVVLLTTAGFDCINSPLNVALNLDAVGGCYTANTGTGQFAGSTQVNLQTLIPVDFRSKVTGLRIYDIRVQATGNYPAGIVTGDGYVKFDNEAELHVLHFSGQYSAFGAGVSLLNSGGIVSKGANWDAFLTRLIMVSANLNSLPGVITVRGAGGGPAVNQTFGVCINIYFQADANAN